MLELITACKGFDEIKKAYSIYIKIENEVEKEQGPLIDRGLIASITDAYDVPDKLARRLYTGLDEIEADTELLALFNFLRWDICRYKKGIDGDFYLHFDFDYPSNCPDVRKFLLLLSCISVGRKALEDRKVPREIYEAMPYHRIGPQVQQYKETGSCEVLDFNWDKNFYASTIFLFDRFYFTPYTFGDPFRLYRNRINDRVIGLYDGGYTVTVQGQPCEPGYDISDSSEYISCSQSPGEGSFTTSYSEDAAAYCGNIINPCGIISRRQMSLPKKDYEPALNRGDLLLAFHIPSGEGYNPRRLEKSMNLALEFYDRYFPELDIKGFWSESWLYDPMLSLLLDKDTNIVSMQRRFYCYPIGAGSEMLIKELGIAAYVSYTDDHLPYIDEDAVAEADKDKLTSLQRNALTIMRRGYDFHTTSMIVLRDDVQGISHRYPYLKEDHIREYRAVVRNAGIKIEQLEMINV
ncbi:hypothetical protein [Butyrivibrio sp. MC2013]|uniref:hypothetical protein n=1 Tax=Butyrivibrio sp. MC2013 TaxID=1280686 RepID=UPI0003FE98C2|nr:hypothetical protein [Butyrivibrio sp. MC2013]